MITFNKAWAIAYGWIWILLVLMWPLAKWVLSLITFFHFLRMLYYWGTPGEVAWLSFIGYFLLLTVLTTMVSSKPKK